MTFSSKVMPNDALDPNSLVGSMLNAPDGVETACGSQRLSPKINRIIGIDVPSSVIRHDGNIDNATLCELMAHTYINFDGDAVESMAEVLNIVRNWLVPDGPEPVDIVRDQSRTASTAWQRWDERMDLRNRLTAQSQLHAIKP